MNKMGFSVDDLEVEADFKAVRRADRVRPARSSTSAEPNRLAALDFIAWSSVWAQRAPPLGLFFTLARRAAATRRLTPARNSGYLVAATRRWP